MTLKIGDKFNYLTILSETRPHVYLCRCVCGKEVEVHEYRFSHNILSCGCVKQKETVKPGDRFGRLTVLKFHDYIITSANARVRRYLCQCDCGKTKIARVGNLKSGNTKSCGCAVHNVFKDEQTMPSRLFTTPQKNNTSGCIGVSWDSKGHFWRAYLFFKKHKYELGTYEKKEDAIKARREAEEHIYGSFLEWYIRKYPNKKIKYLSRTEQIKGDESKKKE